MGGQICCLATIGGERLKRFDVGLALRAGLLQLPARLDRA